MKRWIETVKPLKQTISFPDFPERSRGQAKSI